ncbi:hypothetical protein [Isoptericola sp. NPDC057559]|uniref:hypothetical protein n=1 Tax=Isoptericola sp. NPDC057559 TaxID=3346168 RepID=UPI0036BC3F4D
MIAPRPAGAGSPRRPGAMAGACAVGLALAAAALPAEGARAAGDDPPGGVALSLDGDRWSRDLDAPLFDTARWVPGETRRSVVLVRNDGPGAAQGDVVVALGPGDGAAGRALADALRVRVRAEGSRWATDGAPVDLAESEVLPVALEVTLDPAAGDETQGGTVPLDVVVTLGGTGTGDGGGGADGADDGDGPGGADGAPGGERDEVRGDGALPRTGRAPAAALLAAAGAVLLGALLRTLAARRGGRRG